MWVMVVVYVVGVLVLAWALCRVSAHAGEREERIRRNNQEGKS